jgi:hypothetical protein
MCSIRTHGREAWTHEVLETCFNRFDADKAEARWIAHYGTTDPAKGFNIQPGG